MPNVLVVDDHPDSCRMLVSRVEQIHGPAVCIESGWYALAFLQQAVPKLVFLDWMMPGVSGLDVLRELRADPKSSALPVVIFTALTDPAVRREALDAGAQEVVTKGDFDEVFRAVKKYVV